MTELSDSVLHEGLAIDLVFREAGPEFGDLFTICGYENPNFPPKTQVFASVTDLGFEQVDDYFGIRSESDGGDDVVVWLFPLIKGEEVYHESGPFDGVRLGFNVLRHPPDRASTFVEVVQRMASDLPVDVRDASLGSLIPLASLSFELAAKIHAIQEHWLRRGVQCGSPEALAIDW